MAHLKLLWGRNLAGYRVETVGSGKTLMDSERQQIVAVQGKPETYDRFSVPGLARRLALWRPGNEHMPRPDNAEGALDFVQRYGFLRSFHTGPEGVDFIASQIRVAQQLVSLTDAKDWNGIQAWADHNAKAIRLHPTFEYLEDEDRAEMFFAPATLLDAIWIQALQDIAKATDLRSCDRPGCPEWFAVGPGTGRPRDLPKDREGVRYCGPKCQKAHAYMRTKGNR